MKKKIIVIAKNKQEFNHFLHEIHDDYRDQFVYADAHTLGGIEAFTVIEVGNSYTKKDYYLLKRLAISRIRE